METAALNSGDPGLPEAELHSPEAPAQSVVPRATAGTPRGQLGKELGAGNGCPSQENAVRAEGQRDPGLRAEGEGGSLPPAPGCDPGTSSLPLFLHLQSGGVTAASFRQVAIWDWWAPAPREGGGGCRGSLGPLLSSQVQGRVLLLTICAAGIGGTFQFGYNLSIINAPTLVRTLHAHCYHPSVNSGPRCICRPPSAWWSFLPRLHLHWAVPQALRVQIQLCPLS